MLCGIANGVRGMDIKNADSISKIFYNYYINEKDMSKRHEYQECGFN